MKILTAAAMLYDGGGARANAASCCAEGRALVEWGAHGFGSIWKGLAFSSARMLRMLCGSVYSSGMGS